VKVLSFFDGQFIFLGYGLSCVTLLFVAIGEIWLGLGGSDAGYTINLIAVAVVALGCTG